MRIPSRVWRASVLLAMGGAALLLCLPRGCAGSERVAVSGPSTDTQKKTAKPVASTGLSVARPVTEPSVPAQSSRAPAVPLVDDELAGLLRLTQVEREKLEALAQTWRQRVNHVLAAHAKIERRSPNVSVVSVLVPESSAVILRASFYADLESTFGKNRADEMREEFQFGRIYGHLFHFGEFATHLEFTGNGESLANSRSVRVLIASDFVQQGPGGWVARDREIEEVWDLATFRELYGELADVVLNSGATVQ